MLTLALPELRPAEFSEIAEFVHKRCGICLHEGKQLLVASRLAKLIRAGGFPSFRHYMHYVRTDATGTALVEMIDCLTTNHTSFLREADHFRFLTQHAASLLTPGEPLRIWSAACSSGEEPYSILFTLASQLGFNHEIEILASDISTRVLEQARSGVFSRDRVQSLPEGWRNRFMLADRDEKSFRVKPEYSNRIEFRRINLIEPIVDAHHFHFIFCRNVMIYFDRDTRLQLAERLANCLVRGGYLLVGHAESLLGVSQSLHQVCPAVYRRD